jgi:rhodanese-related sulfurtransferase
MMTAKTLEEVLAKAVDRAKSRGLPYLGALLPQEAYEVLQQASSAKLVDVRTRAEWNYVGRIPDALEVEWQRYPGGEPNPDFLSELEGRVEKAAPVMFICRSGARSHSAAAVAAAAGYRQAFNVLEGFEGDKDAQGHRNTIGGWRFAGLPWFQG